MRVEQPSLFRRPIAGVDIVWLPTFDFPLLPIRAARIIATVDRAVAEAKRGNGVYVYCKMGRHRSVMMAAAILIALGSTPEAAISLIKEKRAAANPDIYYIRAAIMEFDHYWQERQASKRMLQD
jgi:protein-tyrosine phosphatase